MCALQADGTQLDAQVRAAAASGGCERTRAAAARAARAATPVRALRADAVHRRHRLPEPACTPLSDLNFNFSSHVTRIHTRPLLYSTGLTVAVMCNDSSGV